MTRWLGVTLAAVLAGMTWRAHATTCATPDPFTVSTGDLVATAAAVVKRNLTILALGGTATLGGAAQAPELTYPSRLAARLREVMPGVTIKMVVQAVPRRSDAELEAHLDADLAAHKPTLVIWGPGAIAAARGDDLETFTGNITSAIAKIRAVGADLILMTPQYAPIVVRLINLYPYRMAIIRSGEAVGAPVLDRYEMMRFWGGSGLLNLDATNPEERVVVARVLFDCIAQILAKGIVDAVK